jgi:hypothetical protein
MRAPILFLLSMSLGCLQLTGVADYKVEETPSAPVCSPPPGSVCRVGPNCGCPDDQTCALISVTGAGECQPAGSIPRGESCAATTECGRGMVCINNICLPYCGTDTDCDTKQCEAMTTSDGTPINNVGFCGTPCDPANDTCGETLQCQQTSDTRFSCLPRPS